MAFFAGDPVLCIYNPPFVSFSQMRALERAVALSKDASNLAKKIVIWTLRQTNHLTKRVALSVEENWNGFGMAQLQDGVHDMVSFNGTTHLDLMFDAIGTQMHVMHHHGMFLQNGAFDSKKSGRTIWVSYVWYDKSPEVFLCPSLEEINAIDLKAILHV